MIVLFSSFLLSDVADYSGCFIRKIPALPLPIGRQGQAGVAIRLHPRFCSIFL